MAYESMSAILFRTTPEGYLPHYSYIFRKPEPLVTEMNNVDCFRLGTMLHLISYALSNISLARKNVYDNIMR